MNLRPCNHLRLVMCRLRLVANIVVYIATYSRKTVRWTEYNLKTTLWEGALRGKGSKSKLAYVVRVSIVWDHDCKALSAGSCGKYGFI